MKDLKETASNIKLLVFDVDGVMTDGSITYDENGVEYKTFNAKDGHGLAKMLKYGFLTAVITGRKNGTVERRAQDLRFSEVYQGVKNKLPILEAIMQKYPSDAVDRVKNICNFVSSKEGGKGAVRELCDFIFNSQNNVE